VRASKRLVWTVLNCALGLCAAGGIALAIAGQTHKWVPPPLPAGWEAPKVVVPAQPPPGSVGGGQLSAAPMAPSVPVSIDIPRIRVHAKVIGLGLTRGGAMAVPPLSMPFLTGWYDRGPTPGERGAAVIIGHVDAASVGPAVFYDLGDLRPGQDIYVTLADGRTAVFTVAAAALYPKAGFPSGTVFGYTGRPTLRLITCGGVFDPQTGHYLSNIVVFANYAGQVG